MTGREPYAGGSATQAAKRRGAQRCGAALYGPAAASAGHQAQSEQAGRRAMGFACLRTDLSNPPSPVGRRAGVRRAAAGACLKNKGGVLRLGICECLRATRRPRRWSG